MHAPSLDRLTTIRNLKTREAPYFNILEYCRHIGVEKVSDDRCYWVARVRKVGGGYRQKRLGPVMHLPEEGLTYLQAVNEARAWFALPEVVSVASRPYPVGSTQTLQYCREGSHFTVGDALCDYVEWKRIAATQKTFDSLLSLINFHIIPRLGHLPAVDLTGRVFTEFCHDILRSAPKRGNQPPGPDREIATLTADELRRRKGSLNTLVGILRLALRMAWENGEIDSDRAWRCLRRVPNYEVPRQRFLTREECRALIRACRPDLADLVCAALYSGCRVAELSNLRVRDVGRDVVGIYVSQSKSRRPRHVLLPEEGMRFFLDRCAGKEEDDHVFRTERGHIWSCNHKHLFRASVRKAGLPDDFVFHGLRHTYASQLVQAGTPLAIVARQLGHANTDTVSRTYGHLSCMSIEQELEARFAPLDPNRVQSAAASDSIRRSLQNHDPALDRRSWPRSNFNLASGEIVKLVKGS